MGQQGDYVVKADADAVFVPQRLREWLGSKGGDTPHGVYFENCPNVQYGLLGNLEVISRTAASVLTTYLEDCHAVFAPCANQGCDWKFGPWGEDVFMQRCLDHHYVDKVAGWDLTTDGACETDRPAGEKKNKKWHAPDCSAVTTPAAHPFKKPEEYLRCMSGMTGQQFVARVLWSTCFPTAFSPLQSRSFVQVFARTTLQVDSRVAASLDAVHMWCRSSQGAGWLGLL